MPAGGIARLCQCARNEGVDRARHRAELPFRSPFSWTGIFDRNLTTETVPLELQEHNGTPFQLYGPQKAQKALSRQPLVPTTLSQKRAGRMTSARGNSDHEVRQMLSENAKPCSASP